MLDFGYYNMDCMQGMKEFPDKYFDLAIVDPPYGDGGGCFSGKERLGSRFDSFRQLKSLRTGGTWAAEYSKQIIEWDIAPPQEYFDELFRVSKNQIIWGGELLFSSSCKMLPYMGKAEHSDGFFDGIV